MKRAVYGHLEDGSGAGYLENEGIDLYYCNKFTGYAGVGEVTRLSYLPVEDKDLYLLVFSTKLPNGSCVQNREQIIVDMQAYTRKEMLHFMNNPEKIFEIKFYKTRDDYEDGVTTTLLKEAGKVETKTKLVNNAITRACLYTVFHNQKEFDGQAVIVNDPFESWMPSLYAAIRSVPAEIAVGISFCVNPYCYREMNDYEWNFLSREAYEIISANVDGRREMKRYEVVRGHLNYDDKENIDFIKKYLTLRKNNKVKCKGLTREEFYRQICLKIEEFYPEENDEIEELEETPAKRAKKRVKKSVKKQEKRFARLRNSFLFILAEHAVIITAMAYLVMRFHVDYRPAIPYVNVRVDNSLIVFLVQFAVVGLASHLRNKMRELENEKNEVFEQ